jgi:anti-sigma regulatory factor (Ser/Thr protein kinase)
MTLAQSPAQAVSHGAVRVLRYQRPDQLVEVRHLVGDFATTAGLPTARVAALQTAVNELASNTLRHTESAGVVSIWSTEEAVLVTVADGGHIAPAFAVRSGDDPAAERGLLLVSALCDVVSIRNHPDGTTVHISMAR